ncbi:MAG: beta-phosphoglucomutase [Anaerolineae bacterium]|nr:beta-phosphoglucomutase [Anaerolineae bacterium]
MRRRLWTLEEFPFHPEKLNHYETLFTIGNGYLATRGTFEEDFDGSMATTMVHGVFNHAQGVLVPELVNSFNWLPIHITIDGTPFQLINQNDTTPNPPGGAVLGYRRTLDLYRGVLLREVLFRAESGAIVRLSFERFVSLHDYHVLAQHIQLVAVDGNPEIEVESFIDPHVTNAGAQHWTDITTDYDDARVSVIAKTNQSGYTLGMASHLVAPGKVETVMDTANQRPVTRTSFTLRTEETADVYKFISVFTNRDVSPVALPGKLFDKLDSALGSGYDGLLQAHEAEWAAYWDTSDIQIEGDDTSQFALRFVTYHILIAAPRHDDDVSVGAKTLSGLGYKGHVFWDTELFIVPPLTLTQPRLARNLLMYRYHRLAGARHKAQANGYEGAMFPWESTDTGEETTPQWSDPQPDGHRIRIWTGDSEQHISTDIAYSLLQYWHWTGDHDFLIRYGAEIVLDTAVFWGSRVEHKNGRYEISQQIGPDEYHENIDNSIFTNRMVVWHLNEALKLLDWLNANAPADAKRLIQALDLTPARLDKWRDIIANMFIPFDEKQQIHIQFPGFFEMEFIPVPHYEPRTLSVQAILGHYRSIQTQVIKQADVVMLMALLGEELAPRDVLLNNFNTYYPRTDHGSSLSPAMHAWVASQLGLDEIAYEMFEHAGAIDLHDNKGNVRDGIHGAASGGLFQALLFGFCGLRLGENGPEVTPRLPEHWKSVSFTVYYRGEKRRIRVTNPVAVVPTA